MKNLKRKAAILVGIVFLVSGLLKMTDPTGTMLIVTEYFKFLHLGFLQPGARFLGVMLSLIECIIGVGLVTGVLRRLYATATFLMLAFFTVVTLILWILNPVMDCGCFGQAVHLTHAQSFLKNLLLLALSVFAFTPLHSLGEPKPRKYVSFSLGFACVLMACIYSNTHLPILEFTDFTTGTELYASLDEDASDEALEASAMLGFYNSQGEYLDSLAAAGKVAVISVWKPSKAHWEDIEEQYRKVQAAGALPLVLAASYPAELEKLGVPATLPVYFADYKTLITLNRSNGGGTYFSDGELIYKWAAGHFPDTFGEDLKEDALVVSSRNLVRRRVAAEGFCVVLGAILLLM